MTGAVKDPVVAGLRERILALDDLERRDVYVPAWDMTLTVRGMTVGEVEAFGRAINDGELPNIMANIVAKVVQDDEGQRVFTDADVEALAGKNPEAIKLLFETAQELSGIGDDDDVGEG